MPHRLEPVRARAISATALATLPVIVAAVRAAVGGWVPQGDDAYFTVRSLDVATAHHPLLGAWSSGSADIERNVNNLGPLQLDLLAPLTKVAPMGGTAIGVAVVHVAAIVTIAWLIGRLAGTETVPLAMVPVAALTWVLGSEMLITPRQHQYLLVPYLCVLVAAWVATAGDRWALIPLVAAGSLVTQTHLSYPILVAALLATVAVGQVTAARTGDGTQAYVRAWLIAGSLGLALWSQTLIDQFFGWGNLRAALATPGDTDPAGLGTGVRIVADVITHRRAFLRPGYATYDPNAVIAGDLRVALLALVVATLAGGLVITIGRRRRTAAAGLAIGLVAVIAAIIDASRLPVTRFGLTAANYRWLWPTASLLVLGTLLALERRIPRLDGRAGAAIRTAPVVVVGVLAVVNLPTSYQVDRPEVYRDRIAAVADLTRQLDDVEFESFDGPVVIDQSPMYFGHPFAYPVAVVLRTNGVEYRLEGDQQARRFGESRVSTGAETERLTLLHGVDAVAVRDDPATVAYVDGVDPVALVRETRE